MIDKISEVTMYILEGAICYYFKCLETKRISDRSDTPGERQD